MVPKPLQLLRHAGEADNHGCYSSEELLQCFVRLQIYRKLHVKNNLKLINTHSQNTAQISTENLQSLGVLRMAHPSKPFKGTK